MTGTCSPCCRSKCRSQSTAMLSSELLSLSLWSLVRWDSRQVAPQLDTALSRSTLSCLSYTTLTAISAACCTHRAGWKWEKKSRYGTLSLCSIRSSPVILPLPSFLHSLIPSLLFMSLSRLLVPEVTNPAFVGVLWPRTYLGARAMPPMVEWPQIIEGDIAYTLIDGNMSLDVTLVIYNVCVVLFYWYV